MRESACPKVVGLGAGLCLIILGTAFCAHDQERQSKGDKVGIDASEIERQWQLREKVLLDIVGGKEFDQREFAEAVDFLTQVTGIPSQDSGTYVGRLPNVKLKSDLERWQAWYRENERNLYLDRETGGILVRRSAEQYPGRITENP